MTKQEILDTITLEHGDAYPYVEGKGKEAWHGIAFDIRLYRNGQLFWKGEYKYGIGHVRKETCERFKEYAKTYVILGVDEKLVWDAIKYNKALDWHTIQLAPSLRPAHTSLLAKIANWSMKSPKAKGVRFTVDKAAILWSLVCDSYPVLEGVPFEDWCGEFGYDDDSIKAKKIYDACVEIGLKMRRTFTNEELELLGIEE